MSTDSECVDLDADEELGTDPDFPSTDIELRIEDRSIHLNKAVLKSHSPVFRAMLESDFKEKDTGHLILKGKKYGDFIEFLQAFYPNKGHSVTVENAPQIIPLADEYQVTDVLNRCEDCLVKLCDSIFNTNERRLRVCVVVDYILTAEQHNLQRLLISATRLCAKYNSDLLEKEEKIERVSYKTRYNIARERNVLFEKVIQRAKDASVSSGSLLAMLRGIPDNITISDFAHKTFNLQP